jgi:hypothetical protein
MHDRLIIGCWAAVGRRREFWGDERSGKRWVLGIIKFSP